MGQTAAIDDRLRSRTITSAKLTQQECKQIGRAENIFIYFSPRSTQKLVAADSHPAPGDWVVTERFKAVMPGQIVTWKVVNKCQKLELYLPDVFDPPQRIVNGNTAWSQIRDDAVPGLYYYEAYVDGQLVTGGSSPGVIIDP